jgi:inner membrane protein
MPTVFTHAVSALALGTAVLPARAGSRTWCLGVLCSAVPDLDVLTFAFGVGYSDMLGHRGLSHSLPFALALSTPIATCGFRAFK